MINPNRSYKGRCLGTIVKLDPLDAYIPYVTIKTDDGRIIEGSMSRAYHKPERLALGQRVGYESQWSIVADKPMLSKLVIKRSKEAA